MAIIPILVVTSDQLFGELISRSLEDINRFSVRLTGKNEAAVAFVQETKCPLALLDVGREAAEMLKTGRLLRQANPEIKFVIVDEKGGQPKLDELAPQGKLSKPFYLPDLLEMMDRFFPEDPAQDAHRIVLQPSIKPVSVGELSWLSDVDLAAQHLTQLTLESSAQAALITRDDQLWAYAGQLPQVAAREVADILTRSWDRGKQNDLVRFIQLTSTNAEHMLYATCLSTGLVLALIFDAETPFSTIRSQASQLVHLLSIMPGAPGEINPSDEDAPQVSISGILTDVPSPNPPQKSAAETEADNLDRRLAYFERKASVAPDSGGNQTDIGSPTRPMPLPKTPVTGPVTETNRHAPPTGARKIVLEPVSASVYNLTYACLLIPRFSQHLLTGELANQLSEWVPQTCVAYGWRLERISVRPEYLLWTVNVPPAVSPGHLMRILRSRTSEKIFKKFPHFIQENPSGDFWASGYLIMGGIQSLPTQLIKEFIQQTRQRQGIFQPNQ